MTLSKDFRRAPKRPSRTRRAILQVASSSSIKVIPSETSEATNILNQSTAVNNSRPTPATPLLEPRASDAAPQSVDSIVSNIDRQDFPAHDGIVNAPTDAASFLESFVWASHHAAIPGEI